MRGFYEQQLTALSGSYPSKRLRRLCEEGLITTAGRRAILDESTINQKYKLDEKALEALRSRHLIRVEPRGDEKRYELSHDTLVAPIVEAREARRAKRNRVVSVSAASSVMVLAIVAILTVRSDWFQEWQAIREGTAATAELRGGGDDSIATWSLALAWAGDAERARAAADAIEQPAKRSAALASAAAALGTVDRSGNLQNSEGMLTRAVEIAVRMRVQQPQEHTARLVEAALVAESLGLSKAAAAGNVAADHLGGRESWQARPSVDARVRKRAVPSGRADRP
jgi:hypothetical protein